jgi:predicted metal-dependent hydrolase
MKSRALRHGNSLIPYQVLHKKRVTRRVHLQAAADGSLMVVAPRRMGKRSVHKMLQGRVEKVARFLADAVARQRELPGNSYVDGEMHFFLGQLYPIRFTPAAGRYGRVRFEQGELQVSAADHEPATVKKLLYAWYDKQAQEHFGARLREIAKAANWTLGKTPPMRLRKMKRTWGSCSSEACIDYVIAHEICHLKEMNHSPAFYALQSDLYPNWHEIRAHLRDSGHLYLHE